MTNKISNNFNAAIGGAKEMVGHATGNERLAGHGAAQKAEAQTAKHMHGVDTHGANTNINTDGTTNHGANTHGATPIGSNTNTLGTDAYGNSQVPGRGQAMGAGAGIYVPGDQTQSVGTGNNVPDGAAHARSAGMGTHAKGVEHNIEGGVQKAVGGATNNPGMEARGHNNSALGDVERRL
ncbi:hypothetical protein EMPS_08133 [Entomortierella parvispora]|uniref:Uncharacterized protein n=1 Tax=Entomortierella parvispora TaxID=205924 RepID=A0A9P3LZB6_9FUNG|nr:hypothetical protein EMPS_08133 [Entomortierella parvispora]